MQNWQWCSSLAVSMAITFCVLPIEIKAASALEDRQNHQVAQVGF